MLRDGCHGTAKSPLTRYGEYKNDGPGTVVTGRVDWHGFHVIRDASEASAFTVDNFIQGNRWLPSTGVEFTPGL